MTCSLFQRYVINNIFNIVVIFLVFIYYNVFCAKSLIILEFIIFLALFIIDILYTQEKSILLKGINTSNKLFYKMKFSRKNQIIKNILFYRCSIFILGMILEILFYYLFPIYIGNILIEKMNLIYKESLHNLLFQSTLISSSIGILVNIINGKDY